MTASRVRSRLSTRSCSARSSPADMAHRPVSRGDMSAANFGFRMLVERQPDDFARIVAAVAVGRLGERVGEFPFLLLVAPLGGSLGDDVVRVAVGADRRRPGGRYRSPVGLLRRLLPG